MESKIRHGYDASLALRAPGSAALVADTTFNKLGLDRITKSPRGAVDGKFEERNFSVVVHLEAGFAAGADNLYTVNFNSYDVNGANPVTHFSKTFVAADVGKTFVFDFDTTTLAVVNANASQFSAALDVTGTTPSASLYAFVAPTA